MAHRALIIAIENYPKMSGGPAAALPGTLNAGLAFRNWIVGKWQNEGRKPEDTQVLFCSEPVIPGGREATLAEIRACLRELKDTGRNSTDELYVFFSGHGFIFSTAVQGRTDYVLTSDCERPDLTPQCCLNLDGLVAWLRDHMGPGRHYYFTDACRNVFDATQVMPGPLGLPIDADASGEASTFLLQSTRPGATAAVDGGFSTTLMGGLSGQGTAKTYSENIADAMLVHYGSLREYLDKTVRGQKVTSRVTGDVREAAAVLAALKPIPARICTVRVDDASSGDTGTLFLRRGRGALERRPLDLPVTLLTLEADHYAVGVRINGSEVVPDSLVPVDVFENTSVTFNKTDALPLGGGLEMAPPVPSDSHALERAVAAEESLAVPAWSRSVAHRSIAAHLPHSDRGVDFSESLGREVTDTDLDVWLAILGGGRILPGTPGEYHKIAQLPLYDFSAELPGASPIYVLAAAPNAPSLEVSVGEDATPHWQPVADIAAMPCVAHVHLATSPGPKLVSFRISGHPSWTVASITSRDRATLITFTIDDDGTAQISQLLLPIGHLIDDLPQEIRGLVRSRSNPLEDVRTLASVGRAFRHRGDIGREIPSAMLDDLFFAKWVDPIGSALVGYQALRRGAKDKMRGVAHNMLQFFPELPDSAALATLAGIPTERPRGVPLFLDGLRAYPDYSARLPLPAGLLDFSGPWTSWRGAV